MSFTIVQVSDTHLSRSHAYFTDNWRVFVDEMQRLQPDLIVNTGDFSFNGPAVEDDIRFSYEQAEGLGIPYVAIPGNHDVGEPGDNPRLKQPINDARLDLWNRHFGADRFVREIEGWRLIGINSELLGSGLPAEEEKWAFLEAALTGANGRALGLFTHKPLFRKTLDEGVSTWSFVASGHLHRYNRIRHDDTDLIWCPTTAFITPSTKKDGCIRRVGYLKWTFEGSNVRHEMIEPDGLVNHDMTERTKESGTTIALPPLPLAAE
jgi:hypothetical protein